VCFLLHTRLRVRGTRHSPRPLKDEKCLNASGALRREGRLISGLPGLALLAVQNCSFFDAVSPGAGALRIGILTDGLLFCDNHDVCGGATASQIIRSGEST
jgi:hypothetical protein